MDILLYVKKDRLIKDKINMIFKITRKTKDKEKLVNKILNKIIIISLFLAMLNGCSKEPEKILNPTTHRIKNFNKVRYVMMLDASGSMHGRFKQVKSAVINSLSALKKGDVITFAYFNSFVNTICRSLEISDQNDISALQRKLSAIRANGAWTDLKKALSKSNEFMQEQQKSYPGYLGLLLIFSDNIDDPPPWTYRTARSTISSIYGKLADYQNWAIFGKNKSRPTKTSSTKVGFTNTASTQTSTTKASSTKSNKAEKKVANSGQIKSKNKLLAIENLRTKITAFRNMEQRQVTMKQLNSLEIAIKNVLKMGVEYNTKKKLDRLLFHIRSVRNIIYSKTKKKRSARLQNIVKSMKEQKYLKVLIGEESEAKKKIAQGLGGTAIDFPKTGNVKDLVTNLITVMRLSRFITLAIFAITMVVIFFLMKKRSKSLALLGCLLLLVSFVFWFDIANSFVVKIVSFFFNI